MSLGTSKRGPRTLEVQGGTLRVSTPDGLDLALEGLVRKVLREQPKQDNIYAFAADYFEALVAIRERAERPEAKFNEICPNHTEAEANDLIHFATSFAKPSFMKNVTERITDAPEEKTDDEQIEESKPEDISDDVQQSEETGTDAVQDASSNPDVEEFDEPKLADEAEEKEKLVDDTEVAPEVEELEEKEATVAEDVHDVNSNPIVEELEGPELGNDGEEKEGEDAEKAADSEAQEEKDETESTEIAETDDDKEVKDGTPDVEDVEEGVDEHASVNKEGEDTQRNELEVEKSLVEPNEEVQIDTELKSESGEHSENAVETEEKDITEDDAAISEKDELVEKKEESEVIIDEAGGENINQSKNEQLVDGETELKENVEDPTLNENKVDVPVADSPANNADGDDTNDVKDVKPTKDADSDVTKEIKPEEADVKPTENADSDETKEIKPEDADKDSEMAHNEDKKSENVTESEIKEGDSNLDDVKADLDKAGASDETKDSESGEKNNENADHENETTTVAKETDTDVPEENIAKTDEIQDSSNEANIDSSESGSNDQEVADSLMAKSEAPNLPTDGVLSSSKLLKAESGEIVEDGQFDIMREFLEKEQAYSSLRDSTTSIEVAEVYNEASRPTSQLESKSSLKDLEALLDEDETLSVTIIPTADAVETVIAMGKDEAKEEAELAMGEQELQKNVEDGNVPQEENNAAPQEGDAKEHNEDPKEQIITEEDIDSAIAQELVKSLEMDMVENHEENVITPNDSGPEISEPSEAHDGDPIADSKTSGADENKDDGTAQEQTSISPGENNEDSRSEAEPSKGISDLSESKVEETGTQETEPSEVTVGAEEAEDATSDKVENNDESSNVIDDATVVDPNSEGKEVRDQEEVTTEAVTNEVASLTSDENVDTPAANEEVIPEKEVIEEDSKEENSLGDFADEENVADQTEIVPSGALETMQAVTEPENTMNQLSSNDEVVESEVTTQSSAMEESLQEADSEDKTGSLKDESGDANRSRSSKDTESLDDDNPFISAEVTTLVQAQGPANDEDEGLGKDDENDVIVPLNVSIGTIEEQEEGLLAANMAMIRAVLVIQKNFREYLARKTGIENCSKVDDTESPKQKVPILKDLSHRETQDSTMTSSDSSFSSSATKIQKREKRDLARSNTTMDTITGSLSENMDDRASFQRTHSLTESRQGAEDEEVWNAIEQELDSAATTIQHTFREYKSRKRLRREDAVQITTTASEDSLSWSPTKGLLGTGELHDTVVLEPLQLKSYTQQE